jgi:biotin/methionine sulfoxide reductase|tara:strand:- start:2024 stop:4354 length:2331 start_codon:yes stop_codon:yes gene_type:complete
MPINKDLPLTSSHWGTYRVETDNGIVKALHGFEEDGDVSPIGSGIVDVLDAPSRIKAPMVRKSWLESGPGSNNHLRGADPFVEVSWQKAEQLVAEELSRVKAQFGNQSIFGGSYGWSSAGRFHHAQSQLHRFLKCIGGYTRSVGTYSFAAAEVIVPHVLGDFWTMLLESTSWRSVIDDGQLVVAFGGMPLKNGQINAGGIGRHVQREHMLEARDAGIQMVNIGPIRADIEDSLNAQWLAIRPGTDTALLIAIAKTLVDEELSDKPFIEQYTVGMDEFQSYLSGIDDGVEKNADWASAICAIPAEKIRELARRMAANRTMISVSWSLTRQHHGEHTYWAAITVAAMLGQIGLPGGGITFGYSATNGIGGHNTKVPGASLPQGKNEVSDFIPVARISDMLLHPGDAFEFNGASYNYPDIHVVYWAGGNPFHHHQDLNKMLKAWQKPDTIIVHDWCWNSMAKHADIIMPCTTSLERNDLAISPRDPYVIDMQQAIQPIGSSRNDYDIFSGIAREMGIEQSFTEGRDEQQWIKSIYLATVERAKAKGINLPSYSDFKKVGWFKPEAPVASVIMLKAFRDDPVANPLSTVSGKIEIYSSTVASFNYDDCPGHPTWMEPIEWLGGDISQYPLHLISNQPKTKLHSQLDHGSHCRAAKIKQREPVMLHPDDAKLRGLNNGDVVRVFNQRGACLGGVIIDDQVMQGVVQMSTGAWYDPLQPGVHGSLCKHGNPNLLTPDIGTSQLAQGPISHTCMVQIEGFKGELPELTAFDAPKISLINTSMV